MFCQQQDALLGVPGDMDPIAAPLAVIDKLFEQAVASAGGGLPPEDFGVEGHFKSLINDGNFAHVSTHGAAGPPCGI